MRKWNAVLFSMMVIAYLYYSTSKKDLAKQQEVQVSEYLAEMQSVLQSLEHAERRFIDRTKVGVERTLAIRAIRGYADAFEARLDSIGQINLENRELLLAVYLDPVQRNVTYNKLVKIMESGGDADRQLDFAYYRSVQMAATDPRVASAVKRLDQMIEKTVRFFDDWHGNPRAVFGLPAE